MFEPLKGLRVIDTSQVLAGPYAGYQLALLGADVIKIEVPGIGDWTRKGGQIPELNEAGMGLSYMSQNASKRSVALNIKSPEGRDILKRLTATADVFIENMRPGTMDRNGLGYQDMKAVKPDLIYCSISAFGQDGPYSRRGAYDHVIQGMCGIMGTTGTLESGPTKVGAPYVDFATGLNAAYAISAALHQRRATGEGVHLDVAMLDTSMMLMASLLTSHLSSGWAPEPAGNEAWSRSPTSGCFQTSDGLLMLAANNLRQIVPLLETLGLSDLAEKARIDPMAAKGELNGLRPILEATLLTRPAREWEEDLNAVGVPAGRVRNLSEMLAEEHAVARQFTMPIEAMPGMTVHVPTAGFKANGAAIAPTTPPPRLGEHSREVLGDLGLSEDEIDALVSANIVGTADRHGTGTPASAAFARV
ncbi:CaiB/BaiF CoA transferase family protein [Martelella soudanensis]|uniref:CaiB/BaiF CoA transferase family protein n=1 Tax=unclassified Martelella TaxID=2629616 RepID=UPI0015DEC8DE|nr:MULTISPECIES: CoA transferase [unclassified Martelella]